MANAPTNDRRSSERTELKYKLTLKSEQNQRLFGTVKNISLTGLHVMTLNPHEEEKDIQLTISLPDMLQAIYGKSIEIVANWAWSRPLNDSPDNPFFMAGFEYNIDKLDKDSRFFIEHVLEGIPDHILDMS